MEASRLAAAIGPEEHRFSSPAAADLRKAPRTGQFISARDGGRHMDVESAVYHVSVLAEYVGNSTRVLCRTG